jgi:hypothetical protein
MPRPIRDKTRTRPITLLVVKVSLVIRLVVEVEPVTTGFVLAKTGFVPVTTVGTVLVTATGAGAGEDTITASGTALDISKGKSFYSFGLDLCYIAATTWIYPMKSWLR